MEPTATLTSLLRGVTIEDHEEVLKAANAVLRANKTIVEALHTRVVALIKLDRFHDALRALDDGGEKLAKRCVLEKAYALYKTGQLSEAANLVKGTEERGLKHVAAQVAYRAEKFDLAADIYEQLSAQAPPIEGEENDSRINSAATDAQLEWQDNGDRVPTNRKKPGREDLEAFETSYNAACGCIARGDFAAGNILLKRARDLCEALDELTDEEKQAEILPIMVQQVYVLTKLGKLEDAAVMEKMVNIRDVPEPPTKGIAHNNALAASPNDANPFLAERIFESMPVLAQTEKYFDFQSKILQHNRFTLSLKARKYPGVAYSTASIISKTPSPTLSSSVNGLSVLNAAASAQGETGKASLGPILSLLEKRPNDVGLILTIVQLYVLTNNPAPAVSLLEKFFKRLEESNTESELDVRYAPGLVALLVSLYRTSSRKLPIKTELAKAAKYWRHKSKLSSSSTLLRAAGISLLESGTSQDLAAAGEIFDTLKSQDPNDRAAVAGNIASYATWNAAKISDDVEKLTPVSQLISGIDAAALEENGIPTLAKAPTTFAAQSKKRSADADKKEISAPSKKRKIPKRKIPKDFEEGKTMDPERWLPLRDRSAYRPKGKKGKKKAMDMTQGGIVKEEESLELAGGAGSVTVQKASGAAKPNKKKKGKK